MKIQKRSRICLCISLAIMVVALVLSLTGHGINYGLDFAGGLNLQYSMGQDFAAGFDSRDVENALAGLGVTSSNVSVTGEGVLQIRVPSLENDDEIQQLQQGLEEALKDKYPAIETAVATASYVGPIAGQTLIKNAIWSVVLASALMLVYIAIRFDLYSGIAAVTGLLHDVLMMLSFMVLLRNVIQMNSSFIAAMLTIVGYSINNTIIIFDRIRENNRKPSYAGMQRDEVVTLSVKESLGRTINTTLTTLVTIVTLYILGVDAIREFSLPIIIGILAGVYSANLINGYVWAALEQAHLDRKGQKKLKDKKA
ncbi:MAG: protein translocase subunit SecF [Candidatus Limiplasma sp.]|nr:protein translocase subunit SecF [Candidatus Limiplasma sp.]